MGGGSYAGGNGLAFGQLWLSVTGHADNNSPDNHSTDDHSANNHSTDDHSTDDYSTDDHSTDGAGGLGRSSLEAIYGVASA